MSAAQDVVFLGPSLSWAEALAILPNATLRPPTSMGDVLAACHPRLPHSISIIDGYFLTTMATYHKEILYALSQGVWVLGASSMGALRAAECDRYGMIGVGAIYQGVAARTIVDDDEVALTHSDAVSGFRHISDPMVTIRATLLGALEIGLIDPGEHAQLIDLQKQRWFPDRHLSTVVSDAQSIGFDSERAKSLGTWVHANVRDPKRDDAMELLHRVKLLPAGLMARTDRPECVISPVFRATLARDVIVTTASDEAISLDQIRRSAALHEPDFTELMVVARRMNALVRLSIIIGGELTDDEINSARTYLAQQMNVTEDHLNEHLHHLDLDERGADELVRREAHALRIERSDLGRTRMGMITQGFLNELRKRGRYQEVKEAAARRRRLAAGVIMSPSPSPTAIVRSHATNANWDIPEDWADYIDLEELGSAHEVLDAMLTSIKAHHAVHGSGVTEDVGVETLVLVQAEPRTARGR
ncbi:MAG: TfuA-like protein [Actinomycetes bacterium]